VSDLPVNQGTKAANTFIKNVEVALTPVIEAAVASAVPELAAPVVSTIVDAVEKAVLDKLTKFVETGVDFVIIDFQTEGERAGLAVARAAYIRALATHDQAAIAVAREAYDKAQSALANDDGSAQPE
jgi:tetrahydromethanopterin S-methyltransferase subunit C